MENKNKVGLGCGTFAGRPRNEVGSFRQLIECQVFAGHQRAAYAHSDNSEGVKRLDGAPRAWAQHRQIVGRERIPHSQVPRDSHATTLGNHRPQLVLLNLLFTIPQSRFEFTGPLDHLFPGRRSHGE